MATFAELLDRLKDPQQARAHRVELMRRIEELTGAPVILYAANTRFGGPPQQIALSPEDKIPFADLVEAVPVEGQAVNVFLHSHGGSVDAAEALVGLLRPRFERVDFIIGNAAKSAATLLALSGNRLYMDERAELGPIDPQIQIAEPTGAIRTVPAQAIVQGFAKAREAIKEDTKELLAYAPLLAKCDLYLLEMCREATEASKKLAKDWLTVYMFRCEENPQEKAETVANYLADYSVHRSHGRPIGLREAANIGLKIRDTRKETALRAAIWELSCNLEVHFEHAPGHTKLFEDAGKVGLCRAVRPTVLVQAAPGPPGQPPPKSQPKPTKKKGKR